MNIKFDVMNETGKASLMSRIIIGIIGLIMFSLNVYLYIWDPLEKHYDLNKIVFGWLIVLFILNYLFRQKKSRNLLVIQQKSILHISCGTVLVNTIRDCPSTVISSRNIVLSKP